MVNAIDYFVLYVCYLDGNKLGRKKVPTDDLVHIWEKMKTHEKSKVHINNIFNFSMLGKINIKTQLNSAYRNEIINKNRQIDKNRYILNQIINCVIK